MSKIDVVKEGLQFQPLIKEDKCEVSLKEEYLIPDTHPDVDQILMVEATPHIISVEVVGEKAVVDGKVEYNIIYIPREDGMVLNSVKYLEKFTESINVGNGEHKVFCESECKLEHIQSKVMNERKIELESKIGIDINVYKEVEFDIVKNVESTGGMQVLKNIEHINKVVIDKEINMVSKSMIRVGMDKPQVNKIIDCNTLLHKKEARILDDKIYVSCYCKLNILYIGGENKEIINLEDDIYISKEEEISGVTQEMLSYVVYDIENIDIGIEEDDLGEARIINTELSVGCKTKVFTDENVEVIEDAYSIDFPIEIKREDHDIGLIHTIKSKESVIKDNLYIKEGDLKPEKIETICSNMVVKDKKVQDGKVNLEGVIKLVVLYKAFSEERGYGSVGGDIPFSVALDIGSDKKGIKTIAKCDLESVEANIEANTISVKATILASTKVTFTLNKNFISDIVEGEGELKKKDSSIIIYVIGKGETLWDLAKKFSTTVEELVKINEIEDPDVVEEGEKLIIPGKAKF